MKLSLLQKIILGKKLTSELEEKALSLPAGGRFELSGGRLVMPVDNKQTYIDDGYNKNDIIFSIINIILDKCRLPEWTLNKVIDEQKLKKRNYLMKQADITARQQKEILLLTKQALSPISNFNLQQGKLADLLKYPNERETFQDFITYGSLYKLVTGDCYMWGDILGAGANAGIPNTLNILPSQHMRIMMNDSFPIGVNRYFIFVWNQEFEPEQILHEIYPNPNWNINGEQLYGFSPLKAFLKNTIRNNCAKDASIAKFQNGGTEELIYVDEPNVGRTEERVEQAKKIKEQLMSREFRGPQVQGKLAVSGWKMGSVKLGLSPVDLGITESERWDAIMLCNGYGLPPELLGLTQKTFNNIKEAEKALTTRSALPILDSRKYALNRKFQTDWGFKGQNVYLDYDTECFPELQADQNITAQWLESVIMMTPDEQREYLGLEALNTTESNEVWVKTNTGYVPLSDFQTSQTDMAIQDMINQTVAANNANGLNNGQQNGKPSANGKHNGKPVAAN